MKTIATKSDKQKQKIKEANQSIRHIQQALPSVLQQTNKSTKTPLTQNLKPQPQLPSQRPIWLPESNQPVQREENKTGLPNNLKSGIESLSGLDMSDVRVHYNSSKPAQLNALAYAQGSDIHVGPGQAKHLPHEAWHTVQQRQRRVKPTMQLGGTQINDDSGLEREADVMGKKAILQDKCQNCGNSASPSNILSDEKGGKLEFPKQLSAVNSNITQRTCNDNNASKFKALDTPEYGGLNNDSGSCLDIMLHPGSSGGSGVSKWPNWWPAKNTPDRAVLNKYMVQGHLWNEKLGGPGNNRSNLTPITSSANSQHSAKVENPLKNDLKGNTIVHYVVTADYSSTPKETEIAPGNAADQAVVKKYVAGMPKKIHAEYTAYDTTGGKPTFKKSNSWDIGNEHSSII
ncbi:MAG: DUF4157 domain-containing protein [Chloroflexota bacterium]